MRARMDPLTDMLCGHPVWAPTLNLYGHQKGMATVAISTTGGGAQVNLDPDQARTLAAALIEWADSGEAK